LTPSRSRRLTPLGRPSGRPERVPGELGIDDSKPGDPKYSPIWRYNYFVAPRDYEPNRLRSERDCLDSGFPIIQRDRFTN
jgi:hypothetical protein